MRKLAVMTFIFLLAATGAGKAFAFDKCDQDCAKCHTMNAEKAKEVLKDLIPDVKIIDVTVSPVKGLWEVAMEAGNKKAILYVDFSGKKVIAGNMFDIKTRTNYTQESFNKINKVDFSSIPLDNSVVIGDKNAEHKLIVFDDPD